MFYLETSFIYALLILAAGFAVAMFYHSRLMRDKQLSEIDKLISRFKLGSVFFAVVFYVSVLYLPSTGIYSKVYLDDSPEQVMRQLARNQQEIGQDLNHLREITSFILLISAGYFVGVGGFISKLQKERWKESLENQSNVKT